MANALLVGVSGLNSHQKMLEVIGNNLANLNTTSFKSQRVLFSDLLYETLSAGSRGTEGVLGGINPSQVGSGSQVAQVDSNFNQGNLEPTGQALDFALDGEGFFVLQGSGVAQFTRSGNFRIDAEGLLVDPSTGKLVQRYGDAGEPDGVNPSFQTPGDDSIRIPIGAAIPGRPTAEALLSGNLSATAEAPIEEVLRSAVPWESGGSPAASATLLNALDSNTAPYAVGDTILISGTEVDGTPVNVSLAVDGTTTLGDLISAIDSAFSSASAILDTDGSIVLAADNTGEAFLSLQLRDAATNLGGTGFTLHQQIVDVDGRKGTTILGGVEVFDIRGTSHNVRLSLAKQIDGSWTLSADLDAADGVVLDGLVENIRFNEDGSFLQAGGAGGGDINLSFHFAGVAQPQVVAMNFGTAGAYDGMTQLSTGSSISVEQNGFPSGTLASVRMRSDGLIEGVATNGRNVTLAQLAIASFRNPSGLQRVGNNFYEASLASGDAVIGTALSGGRGIVRSNHLERSNVDMAQEFTRLIIAQRGFSANARTISVTDEVLEELTNLIR